MSDVCRRERGAGNGLTLRIESMMVSKIEVIVVLVKPAWIESNGEHG